MLTTEKRSSAFRTIGEVSAELGLPAHVLRFWESKFHQIKPHKRRGGHRYYRPQDVEILREIKALLYEKGLTIKGAQKYLSRNKKDEQENLFEEEKETADENLSLSASDTSKLRNIYNELCELKDLLRQHA